MATIRRSRCFNPTVFLRRSPRFLPSPLIRLPAEVIEAIMTAVANRSFRDLWRCKKTCRTLRSTIDDPLFLRAIDLWEVEFPNARRRGVRRFKRRCYREGNPSAIFLKGIAIFFRRGNLAGLMKIQRAAELGYPLAVYANAMIARILDPTAVFDSPLLNPSRDAVREARSKVGSLFTFSWGYRAPQLYEDAVSTIRVAEMLSCGCSTNRWWPSHWDERVKKNPCDSCFWTIQCLWFSREFRLRVLEWPQ